MEKSYFVAPTFNPAKILLEGTLCSLLFLLIIGTSFFPVFMVPAFEPYLGLLWSGLVLLFVAPIGIYYFWKQKTYDASTYSFQKDCVQYREGFLNAEEKEFSYQRIIEVALKRNIIQRLFNLGTIVL